ncbi:MAG: T9SS type A sorting domain-containing protein, partial [Bacteroidota bacterium]
CNAHFQHYSMPNNPDSVHFYPAQNSSTAHYFWDFGDGTYSHNMDPWHHYAHSGSYIACLTVTDTTAGGVCSDTWCSSSIVIPFVQIYPNPVNSFINISTHTGMNPITFQIHDEKGRLVSRTESNDGNCTVNSSGMSSGSYFYQIIENGIVIATGKFMVMKAD